MRGKFQKINLQGYQKKTWCLPQHPAFQPQKSGKVRVAFDGAATFKAKVFNSELHTGPDLVLLVSSKIPESQNHIRC